LLFFNDIADKEIIDNTPTDKIKNVKRSRGSQNIPPTPDEFLKISEFLKHFTVYPKFKYHPKFIYNLGLRPTEIQEVLILDIRFEMGVIDITPDMSKNKKKEPIKIPEKFLKELEYLKEYDPKMYVFGHDFEPSYTRIGNNRANKVWKKYVKDGLGIDKDEYSLKHLRSVHMKMDGASDEEIQAHMRHSTPEETRNYMRSMLGSTKVSEETLNKTREF